MAQLGMDVDAVEAAGRQLQAKAQSIDAVVANLDKTVASLSGVWDGKDAHAFINEWWPDHRKALAAASTSVAGLGQSALNNASEQRKASGDSTSQMAAFHNAGTYVGPAASTGDTGPNGPEAYKNSDSVQHALSEVGTVRATGWDQPGECIKSVQRWIDAAGGHFGGGGIVSGYTNSGAVQIDPSQVQPGDVIQYTSKTDPDAFVDGVHTVLVADVNQNGTLHIVQSNAIGSDGVAGEVSDRDNWTPNPPSGLEARYWRFGQVS